MPQIDGWETFLRVERVQPLVPVIVITARPHQYLTAVRLGVDAFMEKPLNIPILVRAIKSLTAENEDEHTRRITNPSFVTQLLGSSNP
jgi:DNA-binding response OmpR family regulator